MVDGLVAIAVDIGATKIAGCLVDHAGQMFCETTRPTISNDQDRIWQTIEDVVISLRAAANHMQVVGLGVASAGPLDLDHGTVQPINIPALHHFPLMEKIGALVPTAPVYLAGDAICVAVGEHWQGAALGVDDALAIVVSTGVGGGLILNGQLCAGPHGNAGHIGHIVVDVEGDRCPCGGRGCVESAASGPSMASWARRNGWRSHDLDATAVDLAHDAKEGEPVAMNAFDRGARALAAGIASAAALCEVERVVIGGGVSNAGDLLMTPLRKYFQQYAQLSFTTGVSIVPARWRSNAGLVGAGGLVFEPTKYVRRGVLLVTP